jgi:hypothetical protein
VALNMAAHSEDASQESLLKEGAQPMEQMIEVIERFGLPMAPDEDEHADEAEQPEPPQAGWPLVSMVLKTFLNLRCPPPPSTGSGGSAAGEGLVLKREVAQNVRMRLLTVLEEVLDRLDAELSHLRSLPSQALTEAGEESDPQLDEELQQLVEVETLAQQLMPACVLPTQWR